MKEHITYLDIQAFIDGELSHDDAQKVDEYINNNEDAFKYYRQLKIQKEKLQLWATCMNIKRKLETSH